MVSGHPDYQTPAGIAVGGSAIDSFSFSGAIASAATGTVDVGVVSTGKEKFYQALAITVPDDSSIHTVKLTRIGDGFLWWIQDFITAGNFVVPGFRFSAGQEVRISITNNGASTLTFSGAIFSTEREAS